MSCNVLTPDRVARLLDGALDEGGREVLRRHFEQPCEACLDRLQSVDAGRLLLAVAGQSASLSEAEASQLFASAVGDAPTENQQTWHQQLGRRFPMPLRVGLALGAVILLALAPMAINRPAPRVEPLAAGLTLHGFEVGADAVTPKALGERAELSTRDQLVLRFGLTREAFVYVWVIANGSAALAYAPDASQPAFTPGEHVLERDGHEISLDPASLTTDGRLAVVAIASPARLKSAEHIDPRSTDFNRDCANCAAARLELELK